MKIIDNDANNHIHADRLNATRSEFLALLDDG